MSEQIKRSKVRWITLIGLVIGFAGIIVPIFWDILTRTKSISVELGTTTVVADNQGGSDRLLLTFDGERIDLATSFSVTIRNSGSTPIEQDDYESPISLFLRDGVPLEIRQTWSDPSDVLVEPQVNADSSSVDFKLGLLNPSDSISFDVLAAGRPDNFTVHGRISGIEDIDVSSKIIDKSGHRRSWGDYIVLAFTGLMAMCVLGTLMQIRERTALANALEDPPSSKQDIIDLLRSNKNALPSLKRADFEARLEENEHKNHKEIDKLASRIREEAMSSKPIGMLLFFLVVTAIGTWWFFG